MFKDSQVDEQVTIKCLSLKAKNYSLKCNSKTSLRKLERSQRHFWGDVSDQSPGRRLQSISRETSLINLPGDLSEICKSALFEMSLRRSMGRLRDASEMHPCPLRRTSLTNFAIFNIFDIFNIFKQSLTSLTNLTHLRKTSLTNFPGDISEICISVFFEMSLRRCMRRLRDASEMHPCRLGIQS